MRSNFATCFFYIPHRSVDTHVPFSAHIRLTPGNFRGFEKPTVRPQLKFSFLRVARS